MTEYRFSGRERVTIELGGSFDPAALALPAGLSHDLAGGRARIELFAFHVDGLQVRSVPLARWSYPELLWRIAVRRGDEPAWWVIACDLAARGPRWAARQYVRYDVRPNAVTVTEQRVGSRGPLGELAIAIAGHSAMTRDRAPARALLVGSDASWEVPWGDAPEPAPVTVDATVERDSLSRATVGDAVVWDTHASLRRGREHRCGVARR